MTIQFQRAALAVLVIITAIFGVATVANAKDYHRAGPDGTITMASEAGCPGGVSWTDINGNEYQSAGCTLSGVTPGLVFTKCEENTWPTTTTTSPSSPPPSSLLLCG